MRSKQHSKLIEQNAINEARQIRDDGRNVRIGRVLGSFAYYLLHQGRPKTDFVLLVDLLSKAGCDVRDINHSFNFVDKWGSVCEIEINDRLKRFFSTIHEKTG